MGGASMPCSPCSCTLLLSAVVDSAGERDLTQENESKADRGRVVPAVHVGSVCLLALLLVEQSFLLLG